jgi:hypothetical protein
LGSEMGERLGKSVVKSASKHDNELQLLAWPNDVFVRDRDGHVASQQQNAPHNCANAKARK